MACPKCGFDQFDAEDVYMSFQSRSNELITYLLNSGDMEDIISRCISYADQVCDLARKRQYGNQSNDTRTEDRWERVGELLWEASRLLAEETEIEV